MEFRVYLNSIDDVLHFVQKLEKYDCVADAKMGSLMIDAKSLMGLIGLGIGKEIHLLIYCEPNEDIRNDMMEFTAA